MRTAKILAAAALALASASSFAIPQEWTGSLANVKIRFYPNNAGPGLAAVQLTGTGSPCPWVGESGLMVMHASTTPGGDAVRGLFEYLVNAKNLGQTVNITYEPTTTHCEIQWIRR